MNNDDAAGQYYSLWILLNHTRHAIYRARDGELGKFGISAEQARLLYVVKSLGENATPTEISKRVFRQSHTISSLVSRAEAKGLLERGKDPKSKKKVMITLTPRGQEILDEAKKMESLQKIWSGLSETDLQQLEKILRSLFIVATGEKCRI